VYGGVDMPAGLGGVFVYDGVAVVVGDVGSIICEGVCYVDVVVVSGISDTGCVGVGCVVVVDCCADDVAGCHGFDMIGIVIAAVGVVDVSVANDGWWWLCWL